MFNPADFRQDITIYTCPILLSFLCLLVKEDDIDLTSKTIGMGEIIPEWFNVCTKNLPL